MESEPAFPLTSAKDEFWLLGNSFPCGLVLGSPDYFNPEVEFYW